MLSTFIYSVAPLLPAVTNTFFCYTSTYCCYNLFLLLHIYFLLLQSTTSYTLLLFHSSFVYTLSSSHSVTPLHSTLSPDPPFLSVIPLFCNLPFFLAHTYLIVSHSFLLSVQLYPFSALCTVSLFYLFIFLPCFTTISCCYASLMQFCPILLSNLVGYLIASPPYPVVNLKILLYLVICLFHFQISFKYIYISLHPPCDLAPCVLWCMLC